MSEWTASAGVPGADEDARAFVAVRCRDRSWVVDVPLGESTLAGPRGEALVAIDEVAEPLSAQGRISWDGHALRLRETARTPEIFVSGKRMEGPVELRPGDELSIGAAHLVVGISSPLLPATRRALTHAEFRERLAEELARAARGGRPTALVMTMARPGEGGILLGAAIERFRAGDVVGTYAADEVELLLPDTPGERALGVVERALRDAGVEGVVLACVEAPRDAEHPERLMRAARLALRAQLAERGRPLPTGPSGDAHVVEDAATREAAARLDARIDGGAAGPLLLTGEPSTGKVAFARRAHQRGGGGPLVVIPCARVAADPEALERALEEAGGARGGTLVLDELGEMPAGAQARWALALRGLAGHARIIGTSHRDLRGMAERGAFEPALAELFFAEEPIEIPALRRRPDDVVPLATRFAEESGARVPVRFSAGALARLRSYPWPGNVLELRNAMERAVRLAGGGEILADHLPGDGLGGAQGDGRLREHVDSVERDTIVKALAEANHNQTHAARRLGLSRRALIYKMEKYGLKSPPGASRRGRG
jgi:transcriptional regulator with AAA-type ATPase domain